MKRVLAVVVAFIISFCTNTYVFAAETDTISSEEEDTSIGVHFSEEVLDLVNEIRVANGLEPLAWSTDLANGATIRVVELESLFSHTRPDGSAWYEADPEYLYGEVLGKGYYSPEDIVEAWMNSTRHKDCILKSSYRSACCTYYVTASGTWFWAMELNYS